MRKSLVIVSSALLAFAAACGDDGNPNDPDANPDEVPDAEVPDAEPDPVTTHSATISILDVRVNGIAALGSGAQIVPSLAPAPGDVPGVVDAVGQIYDDRNSTGIGCSAFVYDLATQTPPVTENHGTVTITDAAATVPPCAFVAGDYRCIATAGAGGATSAINPDPDLDGGGPNPPVTTLATITIPGASFSAADVGRYVSISGATQFRNNGAFPIVGFTGTPAETLIYANGPAAAQADLTNVTYTVIAGAGPSPSGTDFLADDNAVTVALDAPDGDPFEDFTTAIPVAVGDNFSLTPASQAKISTMLLDGAEFSLGCNPDVTTHAAGVGPSFAFSGGNVTLTDVTVNFNTLGVRDGAEVTITGATTAANNSPTGGFTITSHTATTLVFANAAGVNEIFATTTAYSVSDCGNASVTALNVDFSDAELIRVYSSSTGGGSIVNGAGNDCSVSHANMFQAGMDSPIPTSVTISGAPTAANNGTFVVTDSDAGSVTFSNANCVTEDLVATSHYEVFDDISGAASSFLMPDPSLARATKIGRIQCAALASQTVTVPAGAAAALTMVDPNRIRTTFVRSGLSQGANADGTNPINVLPGHAVVGFTTVP